MVIAGWLIGEEGAEELRGRGPNDFLAGGNLKLRTIKVTIELKMALIISIYSQ